MRRFKIGFIGGGQMAQALAKGFVQAHLVREEEVAVSEPSELARFSLIEQQPGIKMMHDNGLLVLNSDTVVWAVKPQHFAAAAESVPADVVTDKLFVSIMAGIPAARLIARLGSERVVRVMPNTPCLIGCGASAFALGPAATRSDAQWVEQLFSSVGLAFQVDEPLLDAVTGLSGSGPAYVFTVIEAMSDGGVRAGLSREVATALAAQTVLGAAKMVIDSSQHPAQLRDAVTSPGGTTIAGLSALEQRAFRAALIEAVQAATRRSQELGADSQK